MKRLHSGFTLIELMIVVAIIGILVAVGIPQYQNYVARSQAAEGFSLAGGLKTALAEYHDTNGVFPDGTTDAHTAIGIEPVGNITGKYITGVEVSNDGLGTITATFGSPSQHDGKFLRLTPTATDGAVYFNCTTDIDEPYRPNGCDDGTGSGTGGSSGSGGGGGTGGGAPVAGDPWDPGNMPAGTTTCWDATKCSPPSVDCWVVGTINNPTSAISHTETWQERATSYANQEEDCGVGSCAYFSKHGTFGICKANGQCVATAKVACAG